MKSTAMKAAVYENYGPPEVLHIKEVPKPAPANNELLVRIRATTVNSGDARIRRADPFAVRLFFGLFKPKHPILGVSLSGTVEAVGQDVKAFKPGDEVFGSSFPKLGTFSEYITLPETASLAAKPANLRHEEAAALPFGGMTALHFLRKAQVKPGQKVLVYGASGAVGTAAVQLAKYFGAHVTAVCSTANVALVKSMGADEVIDYTKNDFAEKGKQYDVIYETVGKAPFAACTAALKANGTLILGAALLGGMVRGAWTSATSKQKVITGVAEETAELVRFLKKLAEEGHLQPVIDKQYTLDQIAAAHAHVDSGHKKGTVVVKV